MKRILQITNYMYPHIGGIEQVTRDVCDSLKGKYQQKIICFNHEKGTRFDKVDGVDVIRVNCQMKISSQSIALGYGKQLKKLMKNFNPDIVIFHYPNPYVAYFFRKYLKNKKFKFILYWHLDITKQKIFGKLFKKQNKLLLKYADKIVSTSPNYIDGSPWLLPNKDKCVVIPCCVNDERLRYDDSCLNKAKEIKSKYNDKKICFAFGRHVPYKGLTYLVKASKYLTDDYKILIGGKGPLTESLQKEAFDDEKIEFLGRLSDDDLKSYLLACDVFCFPSITKNEAFGIGLAEAMYYGKPTVTFNIPGSGVNYVSINGETGIEVDNCDVGGYAKAIKYICENNNVYGKNAKNRVESLFLRSKFEEEINKLVIFNE